MRVELHIVVDVQRLIRHNYKALLNLSIGWFALLSLEDKFL